MLRLAHTRVPLLIKRIWSKSESGTNSLLLPWFYAPAVSRSHSWTRSDFFLSFLSKKDIQFRCVLVRTLKILHVLVFRVWKRLSYRSKAGFMYQTSFTRSENNKPACNKPKKFHLLVSKKKYMTHIRSYAESRPKWNLIGSLKTRVLWLLHDGSFYFWQVTYSVSSFCLHFATAW